MNGNVEEPPNLPEQPKSTYKRSYQLGARKSGRSGAARPQPKTLAEMIASGQYSEYRRAWFESTMTRCTVFVYPEREHAEAGEDVILVVQPNRGKGVYIQLCQLTEEELRALHEVVESAFAWALPIVQQRDEDAENAKEHGNDSFSRQYRPVPTVVFRERPEHEWSEGVLQRPEGTAEGE